MEEDDFGELYDDQGLGVSSVGAGSLQKPYSSFTFFDDEIDDEAAAPAKQKPPPSPPPSTKVPVMIRSLDTLGTPDQPAERDSDEDDDMLLLGYNCKTGSAANKLHGNDTQPMALDDPEEEFSKFAELSKDEDATENGLLSLSTNSSGRAAAVCVPGITPVQEVSSRSSCNPPNGSADNTNHIITIPGLSTAVNAPFFDMGDNGDATQDMWEQKQAEKALRPDGDMAMEGAEDWDTDSEDDLRIVLNTEYPFYAPGEKGAVARYEGGSEDEDDEDLIIFAGGEPIEEGEDKLLQPLDSQVVQADGLGDKQTGVEDGKGQQDKIPSGVPAQPQASRGYGYHSYNSPYKYVRAGATAVYSASTGPVPGGRGGPIKLINGRGDWRGTGRGLFGPHSTSQFSSWSTPTNYEYSLPPSMTVFDIDLDAFDDKPWRQMAVDVSDFFNFGFDETTWKDYCKQLAQLRLESTMQSKIRVYESGRTEQDYDPDLPPELAIAAGLNEAGDKAQLRPGESDTTALGLGRRGYTPMIPMGRPIEVEGGLGDRRPSADSRKQRIRDSDSILLIDAVEIEDLDTPGLQDENVDGIDEEAEKDEMDDEPQQEDDQEEEEEEQVMKDPRAVLKGRPEQQSWRTERGYGSKNQPSKGPNTSVNMDSSQKVAEGNLRAGFDSAVTTDENAQSQFHSSNAPESSRLSGESPTTHRELFSRSRSATKPLAEERRDLDLIHDQDNESNLREDAALESGAKKPPDREPQLHSCKENRSRDDDVSAEEHQDGQSSGQRGDDFNTAAFREVQGRDKSPREVQAESSGCSSKRQRLVSPEGSHTASWDNYDGEKSVRSGAFTKESRDSTDSAMDRREDSSHYRKKHKSYPEMSRGDQYTDSRQGSESHHRKKKFSMFERRDVEEEGHIHADSLQDPRKRPKQGIADKVTSKDSSRHWNNRDGAHGGKGREEEAEKKGYLAKETLHHKEKTGSRSDSRKKDEEEREAAYHRERGGSHQESRRKQEVEKRDKQDSRRRDVEEVEKRDKQDSRRRDAEDRRDRLDKDNAHRDHKDILRREKEVEPSHYAERRKKEDDYRRKDRSEDGSDYSKRDRERSATERHDRESSQHLRRKEEEAWKREKVEDHHRAKARDGSVRDSDDSRQRNVEYQEVHGDMAVQAGKSSRRHDEAKSWRGRNDSRLSDGTKSAEPRNHSKERKKELDDHSKEKSRGHEGRARSASDREALQVSESHDRDSGKRSRFSDDARNSERVSHSDKHKSEARRIRDSEREVNDLASQSGDHPSATRRKKAAGEKTEVATRKRLDDSGTARTRDAQPTVARPPQPEEIKESHTNKPGKTSAKVRRFDSGERGSSEDDEQKGRSKLERWMSHKDLEMHTSERPLPPSLSKKEEKSRQSSSHRDKHRRDSSVVLGSADQENRQHAGAERKGSKVSVSEVQVNGKVSMPDEKEAAVAHGNVVDKGLVELPDHHEEDSALPHTNMAAKLEKRKERFKVQVEDRDSSRKLDHEGNQLIDKDGSRQERPPRKRRWTSG